MKQTICALLLIITAVTVAACPNYCGATTNCYDSTKSTCTTDQYSSGFVICGLSTPQSCKKTCFDPSKYVCDTTSGKVIAKTAVSAAPKPSTSSSTTSSTTSSSSSTISTSAIPTTSSTTSSTSSSAAPTTSAVTAAAQVPSPCYSGGGCPSTLCSCNGACYTPGQYNCPTDGATGKLVLCSGNQGSCNNNCYDTTQYSCSNGALVAGGSPLVTSSTSSSSSTTSSTSSTVAAATASPVVAPAPVAGKGLPTQTADLRIINSCSTQLWFEARYGGAGAPLPGQSATSLQALPGSYIDYVIPDTGLSGTRFWAKYGCDNNGKNCLIGDQMQYFPNPPGGCPPGGCTPPVDSLFEATWGCRPGSNCNAQNPTTWFDTSQVDGWTIPYKLTPVGDTSGCDCNGPNCGFKGVDASTLDLAKCPRGEDLTGNGNFPSINVQGQNVSLSSVDLRIIHNNQVLGCMSPCKRLNWGLPYGLQQPENSGSTMWMCCPTPDPSNCSPSNGCITPQACRAGPIENTQYVAAVHNMAPGVYSYSYDDGVGLHACPAGVTKYTMEFCPAGSAAYPGTV